ncbi:hypothetical protein OLEAN_C33940 [Oleispira antarctica RB-8]|uniref:Uncharacterized protein n=1 Tax=Oleispira antarctica RB-8 TaxID=698738 RepID=R4YRM7_OLEAN|nr:hypothetical protein OLEAN_C33940 [Oleispira antarctica RB-8]
MISKKNSLRSPFPFIRGYAASVRMACCYFPRKVMGKLFSIIFLAALSVSALGKEYKCGDATFYIETVGEYESSRLHIKAKSNERETSLWKHSIDYTNFLCVKNKRNQFKALINARCGGTGCSESSYTIIDPRTLMVELVPFLRRDNLKLTEEILGVEVPKIK